MVKKADHVGPGVQKFQVPRAAARYFEKLAERAAKAKATRDKRKKITLATRA